MKSTKIIISILAIIAIGAAFYGVWQWQQKVGNLPQRQDQEIRSQ